VTAAFLAAVTVPSWAGQLRPESRSEALCGLLLAIPNTSPSSLTDPGTANSRHNVLRRFPSGAGGAKDSILCSGSIDSRELNAIASELVHSMISFPLVILMGAPAWWSYDSIAEAYDHLAVPYLFTQPARDLVSMLKLSPGARVLDVGAGTGVGALLVLQSVGPGASVVALDSSLGMLRLAGNKGVPLLVAGTVPGVPFSDAVFDGVLASFVLSHILSYKAALLDMVRVLRRGGRMALSAWGTGQSEFRRLWQATAESFVSKEQLSRGFTKVLPWEEWFADGTHLGQALREAGLVNIEEQHREYKTSVSVEDFLAIRELSAQARLMKELLDAEQWQSFGENVIRQFQSRCRGMVEDTRDAYLAVGIKP
jgi:ubiquinone/menaquinone biosynthesis C-methylase UbiE